MKSFKLLFATVLTALCASLCAFAQAPFDTQSELPLVILIGDSIRVGYAKPAAEGLKGKADIWSPKENCRSSTYVRENIRSWIGNQKPAIVHINAGLHDLVLKSPGVAITDIADYQANLKAIVAELKALGVETIIWATTTPVVDELNSEARKSNSKEGRRVAWRENEQVIRFNKAALEALEGTGVIINDLYTEVHQMNDQDLFIDDGVHFSIYGRDFLGGAVAKAIEAQLPAAK